MSPAAGTGLGLLKSYGIETFGLDPIDSLQAQVNLANGNLVIHASELAINGPGLSLKLDRFYNSLATGVGAFGNKGVLSTGQDVGLQINASNVVFSGPSGFTATFSGTGPSYTTPPGINATLKKNGNGTYTMTYNKSGEALTFTPSGYLSSDADKNGNALSLLYNADHTVHTITDTAGRVTTFGYSGGVLSSITDPASRSSTYLYTAGNLTQSINAKGSTNGTTTYTYNASNQLTRIKTPANRYTDFSYDASGRVATVKRYLVTASLTSGSVTTTFAYPSATQTTETDAASHTSTYTLDSLGRVTAVKDALNHTRSQTWTPNSDLATAVDATSPANTTTYSYDTSNNVTAVATPTGAAAKAQYANTTSPTACSSTDTTHPYLAKCTEDAQGNQASRVYDPAGNVTQISDTSGTPNSAVSQTFTYQGDAGVSSCGGKPGQVCSSTTGNGATTTYAYNSNGDLITTTLPAPGKVTTLIYDSLSRLKNVTVGTGVVIGYTYDSRDQHTNTSYSTGANIVYGYNDDGQLRTISDSVSGAENYTYDGLGRELTDLPPGAGTTASITYSLAGNVDTYADAAGMTTYGYDDANHVISMAEPGGSCTGTISGCTTFGYNNNSAQTSITYPGPVTQTRTVDNSGRPTEIKAFKGTLTAPSTVISDLTYSYTKSAADTTLVQTRTDKVGVGAAANSVTTYGYDTLGRVTTAAEKTSGGAAIESYAYGYDKDGNRTSASDTKPASTTINQTAGYNAIDELISLNGSTANLAYDNNGNETANPGSTTQPGSRYATTSSRTALFNERDQLTGLTPTGGSRTQYFYTGETNTGYVGLYNPTTGESSNVVNTMLGTVSENDSITGLRGYLKTVTGQLIGTHTSTGSKYYLTDNLGSVTAMIDASQNTLAKYSYDPAGNTRSATGTNPDLTDNPIRYAGGQQLPTGLIKYGARYYDPNIGRFTQPDPSGHEDNPYAYSGDNPINASDPSGLFQIYLSYNATVNVAYGAVIAGVLSFSIPVLAAELEISAAVVGDRLFQQPAMCLGIQVNTFEGVPYFASLFFYSPCASSSYEHGSY